MRARSQRETKAMTPDEKTFYQELGERIATLRKAQGLTQVQLAEKIGFSQQYLLSFEKGRRRIPVSALPKLCEVLDVAVDDFLGLGDQETPTRRGPTPKILKQIEQLRELPRSQQVFVSRMIETVLQQATS